MKKLLFSFALLTLCASPLLLPSSACALSEQEEITSFDGNVWAVMANDNKQSFLFGMQNAIALEYALSMEKAGKEGKAPSLNHLDLSPFEKGWAVTFSNCTRQDIVDKLDAFFAAHPDQKDRHVLDVIWKELILPARNN